MTGSTFPPRSSFSYPVRKELAMEIVGMKISQLPKQLMRKPGLMNALGKGIKPGLNGIRQLSVVSSVSLPKQMSPIASTPITSFSSIW